MRVVVAGLGVQGHKRRRIAGADFVAAVDPVNEEARYRTIMDVPLADYDAVLACIPDEPKIDVLTYCIGNGKHVLVEKPLWAKHESEITALEALARRNGVVCYTAYNHRFEPHFVRMRDLIASGELGTIYSCRMFYGNGPARPGRGCAARSRLASPRHLSLLVRGYRRPVPIRGCSRLREPRSGSCRHPSRGNPAADRIGNDAPDVAQPFHLRSPRRARFGAYSVAVQMGAVALHPA